VPSGSRSTRIQTTTKTSSVLSWARVAGFREPLEKERHANLFPGIPGIIGHVAHTAERVAIRTGIGQMERVTEGTGGCYVEGVGYRGTSVITNSPPLGSYGGPMPRAL